MTFVDDCRREWKRLRVSDAVANEMAAELTADLEEAASEGASPEDVLGYADRAPASPGDGRLVVRRRRSWRHRRDARNVVGAR